METNIDREENARGCLTHSSPALEAGVSCLGKDDEIYEEIAFVMAPINLYVIRMR